MPVEQVSALTRGITRLSVAVAVALTAAKAVVWLFSGSIALLASLADSALDVVAALATFMAVRYAAAPPDREHRYGHGKAEAFASLLQAGLVFASAALVGEEAIMHLVSPKPIAAERWAMAVMAASTVLTLALVWAQTRMLRQARDPAGQGGDLLHRHCAGSCERVGWRLCHERPTIVRRRTRGSANDSQFGPDYGPKRTRPPRGMNQAADANRTLDLHPRPQFALATAPVLITMA